MGLALLGLGMFGAGLWDVAGMEAFFLGLNKPLDETGEASGVSSVLWPHPAVWLGIGAFLLTVSLVTCVHVPPTHLPRRVCVPARSG